MMQFEWIIKHAPMIWRINYADISLALNTCNGT